MALAMVSPCVASPCRATSCGDRLLLSSVSRAAKRRARCRRLAVRFAQASPQLQQKNLEGNSGTIFGLRASAQSLGVPALSAAGEVPTRQVTLRGAHTESLSTPSTIEVVARHVVCPAGEELTLKAVRGEVQDLVTETLEQQRKRHDERMEKLAAAAENLLQQRDDARAIAEDLLQQRNDLRAERDMNLELINTLRQECAQLRMVSQGDVLFPGAAVRLCHLKSRPELNGRVGVTIEHVRTKERWKVQLLDSGETVLVKTANLQIMSSEELGAEPSLPDDDYASHFSSDEDSSS